MKRTMQEFRDGELIREVEYEVPQEDVNADALRDKATQAIAQLEDADTRWGTLTAAQKDAAMRLCVRATAKLIRLVLGRLEAS